VSSSSYVARLEIHADQELPEPIVLRAEGREAIGKPGELRIELSLPTEDEDAEEPRRPESWLGARAELVIERVYGDGTVEDARRIHGVITAVDEGLESAGAGRNIYAVELSPRFAMLDNVIVQDVYVGSSVPAILRDKLAAAGLTEGTDFELRLADEKIYADTLDDGRAGDGAKAPVDAEPRLVIQYKESDLAFLSRLCEHVGISYFFEHDAGCDKLVFTDHPSGFGSPQAYAYRTGGGERGIELLRRRYRAVPTIFFEQDYNYRAPDQEFSDHQSGETVFDTIGARAELDAQLPGAVIEYAPNAKTAREAQMLARVRADEAEAKRDRFHLLGDHAAIAPGHRLTLADHPKIADDLELLCVETTWSFSTPDAFGATADRPARYAVEGSAVIASKKCEADGRIVPYRPARTTPRPRIHGIVTGTVQPFPGTAGRLQNLDHEGRYVVRFHFDQGTRRMPRIRMSQPHAGTDYGMHFPLHPGVEVAVAFLDGDPDRPVIVGALPNPLTSSPVFLPRADAPEEVLATLVELNRIKTKSGVVIEIGDSITSVDTSIL
jgi:type VI secretion system secreted protein VgrG